MERIACVNVMALPLQLLGQQHPDWVEAPMAVVARDEPNGEIQWVNKAARRRRVRPGMRYAEGVSRCRELRAGTVDREVVEEAVDTLQERLGDWTPFVEPAGRRSGLFWLDAGGLEGLYDSMDAWAEGLAEALLEREGVWATVIVGFTRFGTWAVARATRGVVVFDESGEERARARQVSLERLGLAPKLCRQLETLGVDTLGAFLRLPAGGIRRRFGAEAHRLYRKARGELQVPLQGAGGDGPITRRLDLEDEVAVTSRLVFAIKRALNPVLAELADRQTKIKGIDLSLIGGDGQTQPITVRPASPTVEVGRLMELVRLRLEDRRLEGGVVEILVAVHPVRPDAGQLQLFAEPPSRDVSDANRAIERLRAEFGEQSVVRAVLKSGHLPEANYGWEPMRRLERPRPAESGGDTASSCLVRRLRASPRPLPWTTAPDGPGARLPDGVDGAVLAGPFIVSGGWWVRGVHREYVYVEEEDGQLVWLFYDRRRQRWFEHGQVD